MRTCGNCGREFIVTRRRGQPQRWCSANCRRQGQRRGLGFVPMVEPPVLFEPSALNIATSLLYAICGEQHTPSTTVVIREITGKDHVLNVCSACGVPVASRYQMWNGKVSPKGYAA